MGYGTSGKTHEELITNLKKANIITSNRVLRAMRKFDRAEFAPRSPTPYEDKPQDIGFGATISAPHMHAICLEALEPVLKPGARALDLGSGSGYVTACMAELVGKRGKVIGVELYPTLAMEAEHNVRRSHADLMDSGRIHFRVADARQGYPSSGPYHAIHCGFAFNEVPQHLIDQLAIGGKMVIPVVKPDGSGEQELLVIEKLPRSSSSPSSIGDGGSVLLETEDYVVRKRYIMACVFSLAEDGNKQASAAAAATAPSGTAVQQKPQVSPFELELRLRALSERLQAWHAEWKQRNGGAKPTGEQMEADEVAGPIIREYREVKKELTRLERRLAAERAKEAKPVPTAADSKRPV